MKSFERGFSILIVPLILAIVLLVGAVVFGGWAYGKMQDYKNNVDSKITAAVAIAKQQESAVKDAQFAQQDKLPLRTYVGPAAYGSLTVNYPKTWSAYVSDDTNSSPFVDGYFYPGVVPDIQNQNSAFALRIQIVSDSYSSVLSQVSDFVGAGQATVVPYSAPKVPNVIGSRIDGKLSDTKTGSMIVLPIRNMTLEISTESPSFENDFNNSILPNFSFSP